MRNIQDIKSTVKDRKHFYDLEDAISIKEIEWLIRIAEAAIAALPMVQGPNKYANLKTAIENSNNEGFLNMSHYDKILECIQIECPGELEALREVVKQARIVLNLKTDNEGDRSMLEILWDGRRDQLRAAVDHAESFI